MVAMAPPGISNSSLWSYLDLWVWVNTAIQDGELGWDMEQMAGYGGNRWPILS